jgi:uncharacterized phage protein (TIGR01671 family)
MTQASFRLWDNEKKEMSAIMDFWMIAGYVSADRLFKGNDLTRFTLMQYTGVNDKDGKPICADDIVVRMCSDPGCRVEHKGRVFYSQHWAMWMIREGEGINMMRDTGEFYPPLAYGNMAMGTLYPITLLGNIHQNPELYSK